MHKNTYPGKFIVFEGLDGSGQSTQVRLLADYLEKKEKKVILTKEPTQESKAGKEIIEVLTHKKTLPSARLQELFAEDRRHHLETIIIPALKEGTMVISDRYFLSTLAFGSIDCEMSWLEELNKDFMLPDATILLAVKPEVSLDRIYKRGKDIELFEKKEKLEKVFEHYKNLAKKYESVFVVNGEVSKEEVHREVLAKLASFLV